MGSSVKTITTLGICIVECLLHGATHYGWPSLAYIYRDQGVYSCEHNQTENTSNGTEPCRDQDRYIPLAYTMSLVAYGVFSLPIGWMFDRFGLRLVRTFAAFIGAGGCLCLGFASKRLPFLIFPGAILMGIAGSSIGITNMHVAELAGKRISAVMMMMHGGINSSGVVMLLIKVAYEHGISHKWAILTFISSWIIVIFSTYVLLPAFKIEVEADCPTKASENDQTPETHGVFHYLCSIKYLIHLVYLNIIHVWNGLVVGILNTWLTLVFNDDKNQVSFYTNMYTYIQIACGLLLGPFAGLATEMFRKCIYRNLDVRKEPSARAVITGPAMLVASLCFLGVGSCIPFHQIWSVYLVFTFNEVGRAFLYGAIAAYISLTFPTKHFGILYGLVFTSTGITLPLQYGYIRWAEVSGYTPVVGFIMATLVLSLCHPLFLIVNFIRKQCSPIHNRKTYNVQYAAANDKPHL